MIKGLRAAAKAAGVSHETIRNWHKDYDVGFYLDGTYYVHAPDLAPFIERHKMRQLADQKIEPLRGRDPKRL